MSSALTIFAWPRRAARCSGVSPLAGGSSADVAAAADAGGRCRADAAAPALSSALTHARWPSCAAAWRLVAPSGVARITCAPPFASSRTATSQRAGLARLRPGRSLDACERHDRIKTMQVVDARVERRIAA